LPPPGGDAASAPRVAAPAAPTPPVTVQAASAAPSGADVAQQAIEDAVSQIRQYLKSSPADLEFSLDQQSGRVLLRIMDGQTKELIRQVPSDEVLAIAKAIDRFRGLFIESKA
jgi:flagellar protein FlaG